MTDEKEKANEMTKEEFESVVKLQMRIMQCFGEEIPQEIDYEKSFLLGSTAICMVISCFLHSFGIKNPSSFMDDLTKHIIAVHSISGRELKTMVFKNNKRVDVINSDSNKLQ